MNPSTNPNSSKSYWIDNNLGGYKWCFKLSNCGAKMRQEAR